MGRIELETGTYHSNLSEDSGLFGCDTVTIGEWLRTSYWNVVLSFLLAKQSTSFWTA
jgi:hypothetical protein